MLTIGKQFAHLIGHMPGKSAFRPRQAWRSVGRQAALQLAPLYRSQLHRTDFIGVTGSCGKTTTKELIAAVLATRFQGLKNPGNSNLPHSLAGTILRLRPWDRFCVLEMAAAIRGQRIPLEGSLRLVRPQIGVVTNVGTDHLSAFHTIEAIAAEKGKLIAALPADGTAILNADDARVRAMEARCAGRAITYGLAPDAMVRADDIRASWPERLSFTVHHEGQSHDVHTQLCGAHWVHCVLAALAVGCAMDVPLAAAAQAIGTVRPFRRRMSPVEHPDGATFILDDAKAPLWSIPSVFQFMKDARARRKTLVIGTLSDYTGNSDRAYTSVARQALDVADQVIFVGTRASKCLKARRHPQDEALQAFYSVEAACEALRDKWQPGDLVLLKGSEHDGLGAITETRRPQNRMAAGSIALHSLGSARPALAVVGLGNPGEQYRDTPHNVGHRVLDHLAQSFGGNWDREHQAMVIRVEWRGQSVLLIKPLTYVNVTGPAVSKLLHGLGFGPAECVLVHDDLDLPLGSVRLRMRGSDGGHRGVRSILEAFRTDAIRRVRVGVGRPGQKDQLVGYVLTAFSPTELSIVDMSCAAAADRVLELLEAPTAPAQQESRAQG